MEQVYSHLVLLSTVALPQLSTVRTKTSGRTAATLLLSVVPSTLFFGGFCLFVVFFPVQERWGWPEFYRHLLILHHTSVSSPFKQLFILWVPQERIVFGVCLLGSLVHDFSHTPPSKETKCRGLWVKYFLEKYEGQDKAEPWWFCTIQVLSF